MLLGYTIVYHSFHVNPALCSPWGGGGTLWAAFLPILRHLPAALLLAGGLY